MYVFVEPFLQLCLFKRGPQDLPPSTLLLTLVSLVYVIVTGLMVLPYFPVAVSLLQGLLDFAILAGYTWLILLLSGYPRRWLQTLIALLGAGTILTTLMLPLLYNAGQDPSAWVALTYLFAAGWLLVLYAHIFRLALSARSLGYGMIFALGYVLLSAALMQRLFPAPTVSSPVA